MKKFLIVLLILIVAALPVTVAACSNVSQSDMLTASYVCSKDGYELYTYKMYHEVDGIKSVVGTMSLRFQPIYSANVTLPDPTSEEGERTVESFLGTRLTMTYDTTFTDDHGISEVLYDGGFTPVYSYKRTQINNVVKEMAVVYGAKYANTYLYVDGEQTATSEQKIKGTTHFDNEMLYAVIRASGVSQSSYSFSFTSPNALTSTLETITVSKLSDVKENIPALVPSNATAEDDTSKDCYLFRIAIANTYATALAVYVAKEPITLSNDYMNVTNVKKAIVKIQESDGYSYVLDGITIV